VLLGELSSADISGLLHSSGLAFRAGSFTVNVSSNISSISGNLKTLYAHSELVDQYCDFAVTLDRSTGLRHYIKPQAQFSFNGVQPFTPLPFTQAYPLLEWGLNWCVTNHCHQYLIIHAAVVEKSGYALILPGEPGSGKSTLCAALVELGGWRLMSDELTILQLDNQQVIPNPRPISLKNRSIELVKSISTPSHFSSVVKDTIKGTVAHLRPPASSIINYHKPASPALVIYPRYQKGAQPYLQELSRGDSFIRLAHNSFNYSILGESGFNALAGLQEQVSSYEYCYDGNFEEAIELLDSLLPS